MKKQIDYNSLNYIIYCRKSSESEDKQVQSIETQLRELGDYAQKNNLNIVDTITESQSAHVPGRPGFARVIQLLSQGKANAILVLRANRISRNPIDAGQIISCMDSKILQYVRTSSGTCYTNTPTDKMMLALELIISKKDSDEKSEAVKEGFRTKYLKGTPGGVAPIGFKNTPYLERGARHWLVDKEKLDEVSHLLHEFLKGTYSGNTLYEYARDIRKLTTPIHKKLGGKLVERSYIFVMLKNPIYAGFWIDKETGVRYELDPKLPRLITEEEHHRIKAMLGEKTQSRPKYRESTYIGFLKGANGGFMRADYKQQLICDCGCKFAYVKKNECPKCNTVISKMHNPKYLHYIYYYNGKKKHLREKCKSVEENIVNSIVQSEILQPLSLVPELAEWVRKYIHLSQDVQIKESVKLNQNRESILSQIEKEKSGLREQHRRGIITDEEYKKDLALIESKIPDVKQIDIDWKSKINSIVDLGLECENIFKNGDVRDKKEILIKSHTNLIWDEEKLYISRPFWLEEYVNGIKRFKEKIATHEPKITSKKSNKINDFLESGVEKNDISLGLLRGLESNQGLQVMSLPRYHFSTPQYENTISQVSINFKFFYFFFAGTSSQIPSITFFITPLFSKSSSVQIK